MTESIGVCRVGEAIAHIELTFVVASPASAGFDAYLAVEGQHLTRLGSETTGRQRQLDAGKPPAFGVRLPLSWRRRHSPGRERPPMLDMRR
jgi:hypothetical protein